jgi:hypothetical protein
LTAFFGVLFDGGDLKRYDNFLNPVLQQTSKQTPNGGENEKAILGFCSVDFCAAGYELRTCSDWI